MAEKRTVLVVCDYCGAEEEEGTGGIITRTADAAEGGIFEAEACERCWTRATNVIAKKARHLKRRRARK